MESELQHQKNTSTAPSSSSDVTPTRSKPPLAVKVSLCYTFNAYRYLVSIQSEVRRVYRDLVDSDDRDFTGFDLSNG